MEIVNVVGTLPTHPTKKYSLRTIRFIKGIIVHHSGADCECSSDAEELQRVEEVARFHVERRGWPGIGYHYVIVSDGTIYKTNNLTTLSYHAGAGQNKTHVGVCLLGNFEKYVPPIEQQLALRDLLVELKKALPGRYVKGHRAIHATRCPGEKLARLLDAIETGAI